MEIKSVTQLSWFARVQKQVSPIVVTDDPNDPLYWDKYEFAKRTWQTLPALCTTGSCSVAIVKVRG